MLLMQWLASVFTYRNMNDKPPLYEEHSGTLRVAGASSPIGLAHCAQSLIESGAPIIDFFFIGGNAGHQATKGMTILTFQIERESQKKVQALFKPMRVLTKTTENGRIKEKDATVFRLVLISG